MLITFVGTDQGNNSAKKAAVLSAALLSLANNKKVCLLELGYTANDMVSLLIGKEKKESAVSALDEFGTSEIMKGIDALMSRANVDSSVPIDALYAAADAMITTENRFDVMMSTRKENFDAEIRSNSKFNAFLKVLNSMTKSREDDAESNVAYDYVILYIPNSCPRLGEIVALSDVNVCCLHQGEYEEPMLNEANNVLLVTHYDNESIYDLKHIKKAYTKDCPKAPVFAMLHNIGFKDACTALDLRKWLVKNYSLREEDDNYEFIHKMQRFVDYISDSEAAPDPEPTVNRKKKDKRKSNTKTVKKPENETEMTE